MVSSLQACAFQTCKAEVVELACDGGLSSVVMALVTVSTVSVNSCMSACCLYVAACLNITQPVVLKQSSSASSDNASVSYLVL